MYLNAFYIVITVFSVSSCGTIAFVLTAHIDTKINKLIRVGSDACDILPLDILFSRALTSLEPTELDVVEFTQDRRRRSYRLSKAHIRLQEIRIPSTIVIYIPGWWNTPNDESSQAVVNALLITNPLVLLIDTQDSFSRGYVSSASRVKPLSRSLYSFIQRLSLNGIDPATLHIVGFSLGAHVAGLAGKLLQKRLSQSIGKITALDPAKPCFSRPTQRLQRDDANFVHVIHSSPGVVGLEVPIGHLDVYINGVSGTQPECIGRSLSAQCDHSMSWRLYTASVNDSRALLARYCDDWNSLVNRDCKGNEAVVGYDVSSALGGLYLYRSSIVRSARQLQVFNPLELRP
ncbi:hypothetical protein K1T71_011018 [Dendrolimus kikuchii]|uniref:Uncharacterized protein n=1 Tax=Dendrolimus kikuchii TaxID=765133 RepID=A0ACC1CQI2_9NEOP|nr:hypothetical protein K1T71_011018 [Dendrolimus kikuchii]